MNHYFWPFAAAFLLMPNAILADVKVCSLSPINPNSDIVSGTLRIYSFEQAIHAIGVDVLTDYGDDLPYLFDCLQKCTMYSTYENTYYFLEVTPDNSLPQFISIVTNDAEMGYQGVENYSVANCS